MVVCLVSLRKGSGVRLLGDARRGGAALLCEGVRCVPLVWVGRVLAALVVMLAIVPVVLGRLFWQPLVVLVVVGILWVAVRLVVVGPGLVSAGQLVCRVGTKRCIGRRLGAARNIVQILARPKGVTCRRSCALRCS